MADYRIYTNGHYWYVQDLFIGNVIFVSNKKDSCENFLYNYKQSKFNEL